MLIVMWAVSSWLKRNWLKALLIAVAFVIIIATFFVIHHKPAAQTPVSLLTPQAQAARESKDTKKWLDQKNYTNAAIACAADASANSGMGNYSAAKAILQNCIQAIPSEDVPYFLYDNLSNVAKKLGDSSLQKDSIQKALAKAQEPNSGVDPALITFYSQELAKLK